MTEKKDAVSSTESAESTTTEETPKVISIEEFESLKKTLDSVQASQKGVDKANTELRKQLETRDSELEEQKKKSMTDEQRQEYEKAVRDASLNEIQELKRQSLVKDFLLTKGLEKSMEKYLKSDTIEGLESEANELLAGIDAEVERRVKKQITTPTPERATSEQPPVDTSKMSYAELVRHEQSKRS